MTQPNDSAYSTPAAPLMQHKRKAPSSTPTTSLYDRLFKRSRTTEMSDATPDKKSETKKKPKIAMETSRKKEIKSRLRAEAGREIRPLAVGTLAMMASALANQGESIRSLL